MKELLITLKPSPLCVLLTIKEYPSLPASRICDKMNLSLRAVKRYLWDLEFDGYIKGDGGAYKKYTAIENPTIRKYPVVLGEQSSSKQEDIYERQRI